MHTRSFAVFAVAVFAAACGDSGPTDSPRPALAADVASIDFGTVDVDASSFAEVVTIANEGDGALTDPVVVVTGEAAADFAVDSSSSTCPGATLAAGESCTLEVWFEPSAGGARSATLRLHGDGDAQGAGVALGGTGAGLLTVVRDGSGTGTIESDPAGILCGASCEANFATPVTLAAAPDEGSYFAGWSGACTGTGACTVPAGHGQTVTATFARYPETTITSAPLASTNREVASWAFTGERAASFECSLDGGAYAPCSSPFALTAFDGDGTSTLAVRAVDATGHADPSPAEASVSLTSAPLLHYTFDAGTANAGALSGYHGTSGAVTYPAGRIGNAIKFDGSATTGTTLAGTGALLGRDHEWTIGFWFREDVPKANTALFDFRWMGGWETYHGVNTTSLPTCSPGGCFSFPAVYGVWRHLLYRYDGESATVGGPLEIWLDGVLVGTIANPDAVPLTADQLYDIRLGVETAYDDGGLFLVDDLRVFNRVFAPAEQCTAVIGGTWTGTSCTMP
jgi:hypothetical protein